MTQYVLAAPRRGRCGWRITDIVVTMTPCGYYIGDGAAKQVIATPRTTAADFRKLTPLVLAQALERAGTIICQPVTRGQLEIPADISRSQRRASTGTASHISRSQNVARQPEQHTGLVRRQGLEPRTRGLRARNSPSSHAHCHLSARSVRTWMPQPARQLVTVIGLRAREACVERVTADPATAQRATSSGQEMRRRVHQKHNPARASASEIKIAASCHWKAQ
jgi:hypothetical protein